MPAQHALPSANTNKRPGTVETMTTHTDNHTPSLTARVEGGVAAVVPYLDRLCLLRDSPFGLVLLVQEGLGLQVGGHQLSLGICELGLQLLLLSLDKPRSASLL